MSATRKVGRAVEGTGLENRRGVKASVSSNLTPSAKYLTQIPACGNFHLYGRHCHWLAYPSQREAGDDRVARRVDKIGERWADGSTSRLPSPLQISLVFVCLFKLTSYRYVEIFRCQEPEKTFTASVANGASRRVSSQNRRNRFCAARILY